MVPHFPKLPLHILTTSAGGPMVVSLAFPLHQLLLFTLGVIKDNLVFQVLGGSQCRVHSWKEQEKLVQPGPGAWLSG